MTASPKLLWQHPNSLAGLQVCTTSAALLLFSCCHQHHRVRKYIFQIIILNLWQKRRQESQPWYFAHVNENIKVPFQTHFSLEEIQQKEFCSGTNLWFWKMKRIRKCRYRHAFQWWQRATPVDGKESQIAFKCMRKWLYFSTMFWLKQTM